MTIVHTAASILAGILCISLLLRPQTSTPQVTPARPANHRNATAPSSGSIPGPRTAASAVAGEQRTLYRVLALARHLFDASAPAASDAPPAPQPAGSSGTAEPAEPSVSTPPEPIEPPPEEVRMVEAEMLGRIVIGGKRLVVERESRRGTIRVRREDSE